MFDLTSSKLLILGIIALIVVGPKELPVLLRTVGKYLAMIRRQANEFKSQFDDAIRETELDQIRKDVEKVGADAEKSMRDAEHSLNDEIAKANAAVETEIKSTEADVTKPVTPGSDLSALPDYALPDPVLPDPVIPAPTLPPLAMQPPLGLAPVTQAANKIDAVKVGV